MRVWAVPLAVVLGLFLPLAGCLDLGDDVEPDDAGETPADLAPDPDLVGASGVKGRVLTQGFEPIAAATVRVSFEGQFVKDALTDAQGRYEITGLDAKTYLVQASAACCKVQSARVTLPPGDFHTHDIRLDAFQSVLPHVIRDTWTGFIGCSGYFPVVGVLFNPQGACAETDPNNDPVLALTLEPNLETVLVAMEWEQATTNVLNDLQIIMTKGEALFAGNRFFTVSGPSPLEIRLGPEDAEGGEHLYFAHIDEPWPAFFTVMAGEPGNVVYQQPFTLHYAFYYHEPAPEGASAFPSDPE